MKQWKKKLAGGLSVIMALGLIPAKAWAAAANIVVETTPVYAQVYEFDRNNTALVRKSWEEETLVRVQVSDAGLTEVGTAAAAEADDAPLQGYYDSDSGKYGYQDPKGNVVVPAIYDEMWEYYVTDETRYLPMRQGDKWGALDVKGAQVLPFQYDNVYSEDGCDYLTVCQNEKWGVVDAAGKVVIPLEQEWYCAFDTDEKGTPLAWFDEVVYDLTTGKERFRLPEGYQMNHTFYGGPVAVIYTQTEDDKMLYSLIDSTGKTVIPGGTYDGITVCNETTIMVGKKRPDSYQTDWAVAKTDGTVLSDFCYSDGYDIGEGLIQVCDPETYQVGCVDATGKLVIPIMFDGIQDFQNGIAVASKSDENYNYYFGMIDTQGNEVLPFQYDYVIYDGESDYFWTEKWGDGGVRRSVGKLDRTAAGKPVNVAYARTQNIDIDGTPVSFQAYALKDAQGNETNYVKLRDVAYALNGSAAQFQVDWDGVVTITTGTAYTANGSEMSTPYSGDRSYEVGASAKVNGEMAQMDAIVLKDDQGNGYTYYKLRDLGTALGFTVDWTAERGVFITTH